MSDLLPEGLPEAIEGAAVIASYVVAGAASLTIGAEVIGQAIGLAPGEATNIIINPIKEKFTNKDHDDDKK